MMEPRIFLKWKEWTLSFSWMGLSMKSVPFLPFLLVGVVYCATDICIIDVKCMKG